MTVLTPAPFSALKSLALFLLDVGVARSSGVWHGIEKRVTVTSISGQRWHSPRKETRRDRLPFPLKTSKFSRQGFTTATPALFYINFVPQLRQRHHLHVHFLCDWICFSDYALRVPFQPKSLKKDCQQSFALPPRLALERSPLFNTTKLAGLRISRKSFIRPLLGTAFPVFCGTTTRPP